MAIDEKGLKYFPLQVDFFTDEKIEFVSARFDEKGELIVIKLLCKIYRNGYFMKWDADTCLLFSKVAGKNITPGLANEVVNELLKRGFFNEYLQKRFGILTSHGIQKRYLKICRDSKRTGYEIPEQFQCFEEFPEKMEKTPEELPKIPGEKPQSKVKESKVKERGVYTAHTRDSNDDEFFENGSKALKYFIDNWDSQVPEEFRFRGIGPSPILTDKFNRYELLKNKNNLDKLIMSRITIPELADKPWGYFFGQNNFFDMVITNGYKGYGKTTNKQQSDYQIRATGAITDKSIAAINERAKELEAELNDNGLSD